MPHDGKVHRDGGHGQHGCDKDLSRQHMAGGTFAERHCSGPGQQPQAPSANMHNPYGRIGHCPFLEPFLKIDTWTAAPLFHPTVISTELRERQVPLCRARSQSTYSEIIPIVPSHVSTN